MLSTQSDERLVDLVRAGSDAAFETIVERYRRTLMRYVSRFLPAERAEDVVQQSFVKAYEALLRDEAEIALRPWLYRIAHNNAMNALRERSLRHTELDDQFGGVERPDQTLERAQDLRDVVVAVQALPERQRDAILLRELEGRSYEEIAEALGVTDGAVRQLLNRARNALRAAAAAVMPAPLLTRAAGAESAEPAAARVAELVGIGAGSAVMAKAAATVLVTGAVVGGAAVAPRVGGGDQPAASDAVAAEKRSDSREAARAPGPDIAPSVTPAAPLPVRPDGGGSDDGDRSGRRGGDTEDHSGPGGGGGEDSTDPEDHSGPGGGGDSSGPGGGGSGSNSGPGSGSGSGGHDEPDDPEEPDADLLEPDNSGSGSGP